ncbi:hypothetical protein ABZ700_25805 [Streptomyces diastaticus]|uniref:hypothetical protein n=1 Tax=Streptomyces diastaticus TaxID=1956 RepID=UPI0033F77595
MTDEYLTPEYLAEIADLVLSPDMPDGTGAPGDSRRAQCAAKTMRAMARGGEIAWRDIVWAHLASAITETDPARLRAALAPVAATLDSWIAALDLRISTEPTSPDSAATGREAEPHALAAEAVTEKPVDA